MATGGLGYHHGGGESGPGPTGGAFTIFQGLRLEVKETPSVETMRPFLNCSKCSFLPFPPEVYSCEDRGHILCQSCRAKTILPSGGSICSVSIEDGGSVCRSTVTQLGPSSLFNTFYYNSIFECPYRMYGCGGRIIGSELKAHARKCCHRPPLSSQELESWNIDGAVDSVDLKEIRDRGHVHRHEQLEAKSPAPQANQGSGSGIGRSVGTLPGNQKITGTGSVVGGTGPVYPGPPALNHLPGTVREKVRGESEVRLNLGFGSGIEKTFGTPPISLLRGYRAYSPQNLLPDHFVDDDERLESRGQRALRGTAKAIFGPWELNPPSWTLETNKRGAGEPPAGSSTSTGITSDRNREQKVHHNAHLFERREPKPVDEGDPEVMDRAGSSNKTPVPRFVMGSDGMIHEPNQPKPLGFFRYRHAVPPREPGGPAASAARPTSLAARPAFVATAAATIARGTNQYSDAPNYGPGSDPPSTSNSQIFIRGPGNFVRGRNPFVNPRFPQL